MKGSGTYTTWVQAPPLSTYVLGLHSIMGSPPFRLLRFITDYKRALASIISYQSLWLQIIISGRYQSQDLYSTLRVEHIFAFKDHCFVSAPFAGNLQDGVVCDEDAWGRVDAREADGEDLQADGHQQRR